ncbi:poly(ethylene terephthalate) hydrolase family protein [Streptomyces sp. URMC 129]|uniref:poly(ethylene terephthalate) hydrolase family protein n=1 Tax=Streptomyces sp. URMC 129 TaxID=3423407 RepID=UPI003F1E1A6D
MGQHRMNRRHLLKAGAAGVVVTAATAAAASGATGPATQRQSLSATDPTAAWDARGPHRVATRKTAVTTYYHPEAPATTGTTFPVVLWGNGTFAVPGVYQALLGHWASHGFIVAAANTPFANSGAEMLAGLDDLTAENARKGGAFHGAVDLAHVATTGHSQGGAGALNAAFDARVTSVLPLQPGPLASATDLHCPMLLLTGAADRIVPPDTVVSGFYEKARVPTVYASLRDADHFAPTFTQDGGGFRGLTTAWLLATLRADAAARRVFGAAFPLAGHPEYADVRRNQAARDTFAGW